MADAIRVFKFGGASVRDASGIRNVGKIVSTYGKGPLAVIVSAIGKTTNALEGVVSAFAKTNNEEATAKLVAIKQNHYEVARDLLGDEHPIYAQLNDAFVEVEWLLEEPFDQAYDYVYDQIVSIGEVASTLLLTAFLQSSGVKVQWFDARGLIRTDGLHREAWVDWPTTEQLIKKQMVPSIQAGTIAVTQGFIGSTSDNETTTLGREGSDYSAAILSYCLDAESMSIWKDVPGVLTADPRLFDNVTKIDHLSFREAIEMTYYGAKVIHPKTIKPLQNKAIPLFVKSFLDPEGSGTRIDGNAPITYPPIITVESDQALIQISTRDFSFVAEHHLKDLFNLIAEYRLQVNMMQNSAISFSISVNDQEDRVDRFAKALEDNFTCEIRRGLELTTVRHADDLVVEQQRKGKMRFMNHRVGNAVQMVLGAMEVPVRKG
ncbi:MAG: aspartate kinase [Saprospiraceae bacterium]